MQTGFSGDITIFTQFWNFSLVAISICFYSYSVLRLILLIANCASQSTLLLITIVFCKTVLQFDICMLFTTLTCTDYCKICFSPSLLLQFVSDNIVHLKHTAYRKNCISHHSSTQNRAFL